MNVNNCVRNGMPVRQEIMSAISSTCKFLIDRWNWLHLVVRCKFIPSKTDVLE